MAIPKNKEELLADVEDCYAKLRKDLSSIPPEYACAKELEGHQKDTLMSINNLLAYLIGWGELVLKWNERMDNNEAVDFPETGYKWNQLGLLAQKFYADYEELDFLALLQRLDTTVERILKLIEGCSNADLYERAWYDKWTKGRMIQFNSSSPYKNARTRTRKWKKQRGIK